MSVFEFLRYKNAKTRSIPHHKEKQNNITKNKYFEFFFSLFLKKKTRQCMQNTLFRETKRHTNNREL